MARLLWLPDVLRGAGLKVSEVNGWRTRGADGMRDLRGVLLHHTGGLAAGNFPALTTLLNGNGETPPPLAQLGLGRDGTWFIVASGLANHAGKGAYAGLPANNANPYLIGVEAQSSGVGPSDWTQAQIEAYPRGVAALLRHIGRGAEWAIGHKEWTKRKIDPARWPGDMQGFRASVARWLNNQGDDVSYDDAYRAVRDILNEEFDNPNNSGRKTNLRAQISHSDWRTDYAISQLTGRIAGLTEAVGQLAQGRQVDVAAITQAAEAGARQALGQDQG
ncbi:N-acetylmuramoyl-L-alanine amidase [Crossiella sp. CA198]|uniref:N-acetylmuramoyl-L-alanine amidase n=1 Tax=Crossiella sp. CA198 TaxID=3455607 RepID=UPI003F8D849F